MTEKEHPILTGHSITTDANANGPRGLLNPCMGWESLFWSIYKKTRALLCETNKIATGMRGIFVDLLTVEGNCGKIRP